MSTERQRGTLGVETLEDRTLLAVGGTVTIKHVAGIVNVNGDSRNNCVEVTSRRDEIRIEGCQGTTVEGEINPDKAIRSFVFRMFEGNDSLTVRDVHFSARVYIHMNEGKDDLRFVSVQADRGIFIGTGKQKDVITVERSTATHFSVNGKTNVDRYIDEGRNAFDKFTCIDVEKGCG